MELRCGKNSVDDESLYFPKWAIRSQVPTPELLLFRKECSSTTKCGWVIGTILNCLRYSPVPLGNLRVVTGLFQLILLSFFHYEGIRKLFYTFPIFLKYRKCISFHLVKLTNSTKCEHHSQ